MVICCISGVDIVSAVIKCENASAKMMTYNMQRRARIRAREIISTYFENEWHFYRAAWNADMV